LIGALKASTTRRRFGAALFLGVFALAAQAQEIVSWKTFAQVELTRADNRIAPRFSEALAALDQKEVKTMQSPSAVSYRCSRTTRPGSSTG
jgi:hypothetical protein